MGAPYMGGTAVALGREIVKKWGNSKDRKELENAGVKQKDIDEVRKVLKEI